LVKKLPFKLEDYHWRPRGCYWKTRELFSELERVVLGWGFLWVIWNQNLIWVSLKYLRKGLFKGVGQVFSLNERGRKRGARFLPLTLKALLGVGLVPLPQNFKGNWGFEQGNPHFG